MIAVWNELHTFLIYAVLGYALIYPLALLCLRLFSIDHPGQRRQFYVLAMLSPMIGFVLYHTIFMTRCQVELIQARVEGEALLLLCMVADRALHIAAPILIVLIILGLGKALTAAILVRRLRFKAVKPYHGISNRVEFILGRRCASIGLGIPEIIYSNRAGFAAFT
ncbi:MAG TPA: hypothetical protein VLH18_08155, partial [Candidatus Limnocylindrales bacterium]|nr:hypothetical protein [Candidatus Limnocylindrales bacterium]